MIVLSVSLVGASIILTATANSLIEFIILRFISGMGAGALLASQATLSAEYSPDKYRAASVAVVTSGYPMGAMMTSVVAGFIMPDYGWRGMFWFGGIFTLTMGLVAWMLIPESLKYLFERRPENSLERVNGILEKLKKPTLSALPLVATEKESKDGNLFKVMLKLLAPEHRLKTITLWTAFFLCISTLYFLMSWIPKLMEDTGYAASIGRGAFFNFNLGGVIGIYLIAWMSTRWKLSNLVFIMSFLSAVGMVIFAFAPNNLSLLMALILAIGVLQQGGFTGMYAVASKVYPTEIRSTGIGWAIGLGRLGAVAGPAIAGYLIAAGFDMSANFIFFAVPMAMGGFIAYLLHVR
jgi:MFS family permease